MTLKVTLSHQLVQLVQVRRLHLTRKQQIDLTTFHSIFAQKYFKKYFKNFQKFSNNFQIISKNFPKYFENFSKIFQKYKVKTSKSALWDVQSVNSNDLNGDSLGWRQQVGRSRQWLNASDKIIPLSLCFRKEVASQRRVGRLSVKTSHSPHLHHFYIFTIGLNRPVRLNPESGIK